MLDAIERYKPSGFVGASGTFDTLIDMYYATMLQGKLTGQQVFELPVSDFYQLFQLLVTKNRAERLLIPGMIAMRVDMIVVASCLIDFILQHISAKSMRCSHYSLKEGAVSRMLSGEIALHS